MSAQAALLAQQLSQLKTGESLSPPSGISITTTPTRQGDSLADKMSAQAALLAQQLSQLKTGESLSPPSGISITTTPTRQGDSLADKMSAQAALLAQQLSQLKTGGPKEDSKLSYDLIRQIQSVADDIDKLKKPPLKNNQIMSEMRYASDKLAEQLKNIKIK
jgi:hypothetical protein